MESYYFESMDEKMERLNILFLTYCYPPQKFPRSVQISHLVQYLRKDFKITVVTSEPPREGDTSLLSFTPLDNVVYAKKSPLTKLIERSKGHRLKKAILPDFQYLWHFDLLKKTREIIKNSSPDIIVTFGQPMSTHITGLKLKKQYPHIRWLAHFSDPWVDNSFNDYNSWTKGLNQHYQDSVFKNADQLLFTSTETIDLVTASYPREVRKKTICLPHTFNPDLYISQESTSNKKITLRYIGNFYGKRQPDTFLKALQQLAPEYRSQIRVEFIGTSTTLLHDLVLTFNLEETVFIYPPVTYKKSFELMHSADILLIIDAPAKISPFLPSKLIDAIGANKILFGITPTGASQKLIEEMGFITAPPLNISEILNKLRQIIDNFSNSSLKKGPSNIRDRYSISTVGEQMKNALKNF